MATLSHNPFLPIVVLASAFTTPADAAAGEDWPRNSASDVSLFAAGLRFRIYADHCSARIPALAPEFASLMEGIDGRMRAIATHLLASPEFSSMKGAPVPAAIIDALRDSFDDVRHNLERQDAASVCPNALRTLGGLDDESLQSGLTTTLSAVRNMIRKLPKGS